jgi:hypothetical protein
MKQQSDEEKVHFYNAAYLPNWSFVESHSEESEQKMELEMEHPYRC